MTDLAMELYDAPGSSSLPQEGASEEIPALRNVLQSVVADIAVIKCQLGAIIGILLLFGVPGIWLIVEISLRLDILSL